MPPTTNQSPRSLLLFRPSSQEHYMPSIEPCHPAHQVPPPTDQSPGS
ncbi:unnamed protein product, partial [Rotaria socialis]